jgi:hypothetical protein
MSEAKFSPLLSLARNAQRRRMDMQCDPQWVLDVFAERDALRAEVEQLRKDAERYRWLRDDNAYFPEEEMIRGGDELDAAIDAAMERRQ